MPYATLNDICNGRTRLEKCSAETIYPASVRAMSAAAKSDAPMQRAVAEAIPEFLRFNIVESEVRNVV